MVDSDEGGKKKREGDGAKPLSGSSVPKSDATIPLEVIAHNASLGDVDPENEFKIPIVDNPLEGEEELPLNEAVDLLLNSYGEKVGNFSELPFGNTLEFLKYVHASEYQHNSGDKTAIKERGVMIFYGEGKDLHIGLRSYGLGKQIFPPLDLLAETLPNLETFFSFPPQYSNKKFTFVPAPLFNHLIDPICDTLVRERYIADIQVDDSGSIEQSTVEKTWAQIVLHAVRKNASDIHILPQKQTVEILARVNGDLEDITSLSLESGKKLLGHIGTNAKYETEGPRGARDGRYTFTETIMEQYPALLDITMRVNATVGIHGLDKGTLRIARSNQEAYTLRKLRLSSNVISGIQSDMHGPDGIILVTGPTGSGKTTTLYAALHELNNGKKMIHTIEDPVEYVVDGIAQFEIGPENKNMSFAEMLRAAMRSDPNIILIGEIRDKETCDTAITAAQKGHLCLSTMHTNSSADTLTQLMYYEVQPYALVSALSGVLSQRLVPLLCQDCSEVYDGSEQLSSILNEDISQPIPLRKKYEKGCNSCDGTGGMGRGVVAEYLHVNDAVKELLLKGEKNTKLYLEAATQAGMEPMIERTMHHVLLGNTPLLAFTELFKADQIKNSKQTLYQQIINHN